ncbi:MAG: hypothetical protein LBJ74_00980 [Heliobacteriaceae bacterium]|jgi:hypothetical protein|nr:hypothetical protein [Heliobacteriaceae bacterium]
MKKILLGDTVKYDFIDKVDTILSLKTIRKRNFVYSIIQQKSNPENLKELQKILGDSYSKIKWESLADTKFSKAEIDILLKKIIERSKSFTRMESLEKYYPKDGAWATAMEQITGKAEIRMTNGENFRAIIDNIAYDTNVYSKSVDRAITNKKNMRGILRKGSDIFSSPYGPVAYDKEFFTEYVSRFDDVRNIYKGKKPSPYPNLEITQVDYSGYGKTLIHPKAYSFSTNKNNILTGFEYAEKKYNELIPLIKKVQNGTKLKQDEIENAKAQIAEMTFILTNIMPYERGSANISNMFVRGLYKSLNLESPTIKKGVGLDLEAFILNLDEYILKWDTFFE